jgi:hypothetical protein
MDIDEKGMGKEKATRKLLVDGWPKTLKQWEFLENWSRMKGHSKETPNGYWWKRNMQGESDEKVDNLWLFLIKFSLF